MAKAEQEQTEEEKVAEQEAKEKRQKRHELGERLKDPDLSEEEKEKVHTEIAQMDREPYGETPTQKAHREHDEREAMVDELVEEKKKEKSEK